MKFKFLFGFSEFKKAEENYSDYLGMLEKSKLLYEEMVEIFSTAVAVGISKALK